MTIVFIYFIITCLVYFIGVTFIPRFGNYCASILGCNALLCSVVMADVLWINLYLFNLFSFSNFILCLWGGVFNYG